MARHSSSVPSTLAQLTPPSRTNQSPIQSQCSRCRSGIRLVLPARAIPFHRREQPVHEVPKRRVALHFLPDVEEREEELVGAFDRFAIEATAQVFGAGHGVSFPLETGSGNQPLPPH